MCEKCLDKIVKLAVKRIKHGVSKAEFKGKGYCLPIQMREGGGVYELRVSAKICKGSKKKLIAEIEDQMREILMLDEIAYFADRVLFTPFDDRSDSLH